MFIFSIGLFKKVIIADTFAIWATQGFDVATTLNLFDAWATSLSYTFQLYFDFSGYTDMAIGAALLFNIKLPINFNSPYKATSIQDFWGRWHITLGRFLRDYIYIPLGGNKKGSTRIYINLMTTFIIGGLWHGAGWTFLFWGALHGGGLVIHRYWSNLGLKMNPILAWVVTFNFVNISWVFFRAKEVEDSIKVLRGMFGLNGINENLFYIFDFKFIFILVGFIIVLYLNNSNNLKVNFSNVLHMLTFSFMVFISFLVMFMGGNSEFLYFNF